MNNAVPTTRLLRMLLTTSIPVSMLVATIIGGTFYIVGSILTKPDTLTPSVTAQGKATIHANPDLAELHFGVQTGRQPTAQDAMQLLQKNMISILDSLQKFNIRSTDIKTENLWLNPAYDWIDGQQILRGYEANQSIIVSLRDISKVGLILTEATTAGANQIGGVTFRIEDVETIYNQTREKAIARARQDAGELAKQLDAELGELMSFGESTSPDVSSYIGKGGEGYGGGGGTSFPLPTGQQEITVQVFLTYELS